LGLTLGGGCLGQLKDPSKGNQVVRTPFWHGKGGICWSARGSVDLKSITLYIGERKVGVLIDTHSEQDNWGSNAMGQTKGRLDQGVVAPKPKKSGRSWSELEINGSLLELGRKSTAAQPL